MKENKENKNFEKILNFENYFLNRLPEIIFQNLPKSVENRFRQVPQVDLDLQNSKKNVKIVKNRQIWVKYPKNYFLNCLP